MLRSKLRLPACLALAMLPLLTVPAIAAPSQEEDDEKIRIRIEKHLRHCDDHSEDCEAAHGRHVVIHRQGHGEGHAHHHRGAGHDGGYLGVGLTELTAELRAHFGVAEDAGVMVSRVYEDSPAAQAGLEVGDIITAIDGDAVHSAGQLARTVRSREEGDTVDLEIYRDGRLDTLAAIVGRSEAHPKTAHAFVLTCAEEDEDCTMFSGSGDLRLDPREDFGCEGDCAVVIECDGGDCRCTVNGEAAECPDLSALEQRHH